MALFLVNSVDFSGYIIQKSYSVQKQDVYQTWTDGNWKTHRVIARQRVSGSFKMTFLTEAAYNDFKSAVAAVKTANGYCPLQVWCNNTKTLETVNAFLDFTTTNRWTTAAFGGDPVVAAVSVAIEER